MADRLDSWKDIAAYLGRQVRTVQRWEHERGLPVHRLPGGDKPRVYALPAEIDTWLGSQQTPSPPSTTIAVLPFVNLSADKENEYFSDGLADDILNALTRAPGLRVIARTSSFAYRGKDLDVREIGERLGASVLLEGSVRRDGSRVRISAQLVSAADGCHLWSEIYDRELSGVFALQDEIARSIAQALEVRVGPRRLAGSWTEDVDAYGYWLRGRHRAAQWTPDAVQEGCGYYQAALCRDPRFPLPLVALGETLFEASWFGLLPPREAAARAKGAILQALELDASLGEAHAVLGSILGVAEYDWDGAARAFTRALECSPGSSSVLYRHAWYHLSPQGRYEEALREIRQAVAQDPLSPLLQFTLGWLLTEARRWAEAAEAFRMALELAPDFWWPKFALSCVLAAEGRKEEAVRLCQEARGQVGGPLADAALCALYAQSGRREEASRMLAELEAASAPPLALAWAGLELRDDRVFIWLDQAIDQREPAVTHLPGMMIYDPLRADPRFARLLQRMGLGPTGPLRADATTASPGAWPAPSRSR